MVNTLVRQRADQVDQVLSLGAAPRQAQEEKRDRTEQTHAAALVRAEEARAAVRQV